MKRALKIGQIIVFVIAPVCTLSVAYILHRHLLNLLSIYGVMSVGRIAFQAVTASAVRRRRYQPIGHWPMVSIIVATYNEDIELFWRSMKSLADQVYPNYEVIVVDDGSTNSEAYRQVCQRFGHTYIYQPNAGKRHAMYNAFGRLSPNSVAVLTADGDTVWMRDTATELVKALFSSRDTGAVTGYVGVVNTDDNWLTKICDQRYWMAFNIERASQSLFGSVTCVSGPLGAYRRRLIDKVKDQFVSQQFLGKPCTFGDDRHLTNLVLGLGYKVRYTSQAICLSDCPTSLSKYLKQQTRWGKSHWREMLWQLKALPKQSLYLSYDWILTLVLPFLLLASLLHYSYLSIVDSPVWLVKLMAMLLLMSVVRILPAIIATRSLRFFMFTGFTFINLFLLMPLKFWALFTINRTAWGTRAA